jgi:hypothetical protein
MKLSNYIKNIARLSVVVLTMSCTKNMDEISVDPVNPTQINPANILTTLSITAFGPEFYGITPYFETWFVNYHDGRANFNWQRGGFTDQYKHIHFVNEMYREADRVQQPVYHALGKFFRAYHFFNVTRLFGDIPYHEASKGKEGVFTPKYDTQEAVIAGILTELKSANDSLARLTDANIQGDIIYGGDVTKWRKLINMYRLRILINCTMHETVGGRSVREQFAEIVNNPHDNPLMEGLSDSPIRREEGNLSNYYLYFNNNFVTGYRISSFVVEYMRERNDKRLSHFANPMVALEGKDGVDIEDLDNYRGVNPNPDLQNNENIAAEAQGRLSRVNNRYHREPVGPPHMMAGYAEQELILAEAVLRGWIAGNAEEYYHRGIAASFEFFGFDESAFRQYISQPQVQLQGDKTQMLDQIITQKYLNFFFQGGWEAYFELRRTGYPDFKRYVSAEYVSNYNDNFLPLRYQYPLIEITDNNENVTQAIDRLEGGDNINSKMWLIQGADEYRNPDPFPFQQ